MLLDFDKLITKFNIKIKGIIHIGGHHGEEYDAYQKHQIKDCIFFEPDPDSYKILLDKIKDPNYSIVNKALGNFTGNIDVYKSSNEGMSNSVLPPAFHITQYPNITFNEKFNTEIDRLDNYDTTKYNFINIDVQGYELEVLKGGALTLNHIDYVMSEVNNLELYKGGCLVGQLDEFLKQYNFKRVETSWEGTTWGDALYVKEK